MKYRLAILLAVLPLVISQMTWGADTEEKTSTERIAVLPFDKAAPLPGALAVSADGRIAAHISANGDIVIWDASQVKSLEIIPSGDKKPSAVLYLHPIALCCKQSACDEYRHCPLRQQMNLACCAIPNWNANARMAWRSQQLQVAGRVTALHRARSGVALESATALKGPPASNLARQRRHSCVECRSEY